MIRATSGGKGLTVWRGLRGDLSDAVSRLEEGASRTHRRVFQQRKKGEVGKGIFRTVGRDSEKTRLEKESLFSRGKGHREEKNSSELVVEEGRIILGKNLGSTFF